MGNKLKIYGRGLLRQREAAAGRTKEGELMRWGSVGWMHNYLPRS
jgi:hypothetical protein